MLICSDWNDIQIGMIIGLEKYLDWSDIRIGVIATEFWSNLTHFLCFSNWSDSPKGFSEN